MSRNLSLRAIGIIVASAAVFAFFLGLVVAGALNLTQHARAQERVAPIPLVNEKGESPFVAVASEVMPAVVNISTERTVTNGGDLFFSGPFDDLFREFFRGTPNLPRTETLRSLGSGVLIDAAGHILTNNHVIRDADKITVRLPDKTVYSGAKVKIVGRDPTTDVAVLQIIDTRTFPFVQLGNSDEIKVGDWAIAIGNPFGFENSVTVGVISAKGRSGIAVPDAPSYQDFIQTDASINPGNSGGPLINIHGQVIGINTAITSTTGGSVGVGFAIPVNMARRVADQLIASGKIARGYLGIRPQAITDDIKEGMNLPDTEGVLVADVVKGAPAEKAGLRTGDVIRSFDGTRITDLEQFRLLVAEAAPGRDIALDVWRGGRTLHLRARLAEYPTETAAAVEPTGERWLGLAVRDLSEADRRQLGITSGVVVSAVTAGSPAARAGIQAGNAIVAIANRPVTDVASYQQVRASLARTTRTIVFQIRREGMFIFVAVRPD